MKKTCKAMVAAAGVCAALAPAPAFPQAASEEVKRACRQTATQVANMIESVKRQRGSRDLEAGVRKPSDNWAEQVATYMIQAANRSDSLSESELASLGYAYCVERRPRG